MWSGAGEPIFHADFARNTGHRARPIKLVRNPGPRCFEGRQKYFKKNARGELLFRRNLPH